MTSKLLKCKNCGFSQPEEAWLQSTRDGNDNENYDKNDLDEAQIPEDSSSIYPATCPQCGKHRNFDNDLI